MRNTPLVSISCTTYNHGPFIRQCLEGFMMQKLDGGFEVLIHDDASNDETRVIIEEYAQRFPNVIFPFFQSENQYQKGVRGMMPRFNFPRSRGKYIAMCEGDDYWTDPYKLQKQVDFLEANSDYALCFHQVQILMPNGELKSDFLTEVPLKYESIEYVAEKGNFIHTPSIVFRNGFEEFPGLFFESPIGDYFMQMLIASRGKFHQIPKAMAVYRYGVGVWSNEQQFTRSLRTAKTHALLMTYFTQNDNHPVAEIFARRIAGFMERFPHEMEKKHIEYLITNSEIAVPVVQAMNRELKKRNDAVERLRTNQLQTSSIKKMVTELSRRMIHKLRGNK
jgi:glycosyltransferase involved in cell wall biosynthesis